MSTALGRYLKKNKLTQEEFAARLGVSHVAVWYWVNDERIPRTDIAVEIERVTGGAVKVADLLRAKRRGQRRRAA